ncbi:hypothetical protein [Bacteroides reticulotermitis]|uniref:Uncharacterized protein n=2 Tax=Bacteroides reticulotermitis TaxID=1133319 RepID=W4US85_9BACE|nr:hypothetical protein [Bacteroides reticulotermitis]MBB4043868.1 hypothetical protein [Bacteroides reticulotermitis]GAE83379.1 hypothetical protein JCM10512_1647 [Bacteroides reticulotermitis JCM 10512]
MGLENYEVLEVNAQESQIVQLDAVERANVDSQVATAKQYPRDIRRSIDNSVVMATMNGETAQSCGYALPRGGKPITGPSVHLAKIIVSNWGNMRTEAKVVQITEKQVISRGTAWDLETNVASAFEVRRSIIDKYGKRYSDDMITVTGNAANSIAYRNAVFAVIPKAITDRVYHAAQKFITGDLSDADKLLKKRASVINAFKNDYGVLEEEVIKLCGKQTSNQINANELSLLIGIIQSLKDGDTTVDELMKPIRGTKEARHENVKSALLDNDKTDDK